VQIWLKDGNQAIKLVEEELEHGQVRVEKHGHVKSIKQLDHSLKCSLFIFEYHQKETCNEIHTLAILNLFIEEGVSLEDIREDLWINSWHIVCTSCHIENDNFFDTLYRLWISIHLCSQIIVIHGRLIDMQDVSPNQETSLLKTFWS